MEGGSAIVIAINSHTPTAFLQAGVPNLPRPPLSLPFVWSTTAAGFPAPIITTRSIQIGVSKWPLGSAELEGARWE